MKLELQQVSKQYRKGNYGLKDFSLTIENGILGLLGPNGAGKSTLLKMIATVSKPTEGMISLNKNNIVKDPNYMRKQIGFLPQDFGVYPNLNAYEFLEYLAAMKGLSGKQQRQRITELIHSVNLTEVANKPIGSYSGGMKQRIGIAQTLLNNPKVLIFDEPTVGLDPEERVRFRDLITELANDSIVILSSHIVSDIDTIANKIAVMKNGTLLTTGKPTDIINSVEGKVYEKVLTLDEITKFKNNHCVISSSRNTSNITVRFISENSVTDASLQKASLEDAYLYLTKINHSVIH